MEHPRLHVGGKPNQNGCGFSTEWDIHEK